MAKGTTIAVLGGGSAGFTAARTAEQLGARVLFFMGDRADEASLCVNQGCMPSKAMFEPIDTMHRARSQPWLRVEPYRPEAYLSQIVAWKDREIARFRAFRQRAIRLAAKDRFEVVRADARFVDPHTLESAGERYRFDAAIVATGSRTSLPGVDGLSDLAGEVWDNEGVLANGSLPESLTVLGGGAIALEFGLRYARLGSAVTIVVRSRPLSSFPAKFGERIAEIYEREGIRVMSGTALHRVTRDHRGFFVAEVEGPEGVEPVVSEKLLVASGRRPNVEGLNVEAAGAELDRAGHLVVSNDMRVAGAAHLFAAGDVIGRRMIVHQAHIEAAIAAKNAVTEGSECWRRKSQIQVVFSDPEFAWAGLSAEEAEGEGRRVRTASKESRRVGKMHLSGDDHGFGEFVADAEQGTLLGAGLLCHDAANLIHLPAYMIEHGHSVHQGARAEYYHPTHAEIVSSILDTLCMDLGEVPPGRAAE